MTWLLLSPRVELQIYCPTFTELPPHISGCFLGKRPPPHLHLPASMRYGVPLLHRTHPITRGSVEPSSPEESFNHFLHISSLQAEDQGRFECRAQDGDDRQSRAVELHFPQLHFNATVSPPKVTARVVRVRGRRSGIGRIGLQDCKILDLSSNLTVGFWFTTLFMSKILDWIWILDLDGNPWGFYFLLVMIHHYACRFFIIFPVRIHVARHYRLFYRGGHCHGRWNSVQGEGAAGWFESPSRQKRRCAAEETFHLPRSTFRTKKTLKLVFMDTLCPVITLWKLVCFRGSKRGSPTLFFALGA